MKVPLLFLLQLTEDRSQEDNSPLSVVDATYSENLGRKEPRSSLLKYTQVPKPSDVVRIELTAEEQEALNELLGQLLDNGHISQACQLANQFGHYDQDLAVVVVRRTLCLSK